MLYWKNVFSAMHGPHANHQGEVHTHTYIETDNPTVFPLQSHCPHRILWDCGGWTLVPLGQQFSIPVLAPPSPSHLFYLNVSALRNGHHRIFRHDSSLKRMYMFHSKSKCARREFKLYIFTEVYDVTLVHVWRRCVAQIHEWMLWSELNYNRFPLLREYGAMDTV